MCLSSLTRIKDNLSLLFLAGTDIITETLVVFDAIVIFICIVSLFLCGRSVYRSLKLAMVRYIYKQSKKKLRGNNLVGPNCNQLPAGHTHYFFDTFFSQVEYVSFFKLLQHYYSYWPFFPFFPFLFFQGSSKVFQGRSIIRGLHFLGLSGVCQLMVSYLNDK